MDDLEFRRRIYADPKHQDSELKQVMLQDPAKRKFAEDMQQFDKQIEDALKIDVPEDLASKILFKQALETQTSSNKSKTKAYIAIAASVAFAIGISLNIYQTNGVNPQPAFVDLMLDHVHHETNIYENLDLNVSLTEVNAKLASFGGELNRKVGHIYSANFCQMGTIKALHLITDGEHGKVSVFIMPKVVDVKEIPNFSDQYYTGQGSRFKTADFVYVGNKGEDVEKIKKQLEAELIWQA
ncbi:DUF3379 family protein [Catenovulum maritimum]|uniref:DUF3379 domain-containing protein n=1 Tax=Catenovulum maritimum TaxID=1513271 RepID=A0A0J8JMI2_9ALTE|nr:DUF3379 family protein [Catenovulum maritimum]KMT65821.1 hypothetical protein XM47_07435 [Catenovulum maritimum]